MSDFFELKEKINEIIKMGWIKIESNNYGSVGNKLEELLDIHSGNFEIPDYGKIELKTKSSIFENNISLFNSTPDGYLFEIKRLHELYGYYDYTHKYKILNKMIFSNKLTYVKDDISFKLNVNFELKQIFLQIFDKNMNLIEQQTSWSFDSLEKKLTRKLTYLCYIEAKKHFYNSCQYVKYTSITFYKLRNAETFFKLIDDGIISIVFKIGVFKSGKRKGNIHDHGTSICISKDKLDLLFDKINLSDT